MNCYKYLWFINLLLLAFLDRLTKYFALLSEKILRRDFLYWSPTINSQAIFGIKLPYLTILIFNIFVLLIIGYLFFLFSKQKRYHYLMPLGLIMIGGLSNFFDRCFWGGVIDFINLPLWPTFNLADVYLIIGLGWFIKKSYRLFYV